MNGYDINAPHYRHYNGVTLCKSCNDAERSVYEVTRLSVRDKWAIVKASGSSIICDHCNGEDDEGFSPAWDACVTCGEVAPLDIHGECIACELPQQFGKD